jgi:hypothetical protein
MRSFVSVALAAMALCFGHAPAMAASVAILMPGSAGAVPQDFLVRNENQFQRAGIRVVVTTSPSEAVAAAEAEAARGRKAVIVGMSKGSVDVAEALAAGAPVAGAVFVSGIHPRIMAALGTPARLPPTLLVHHRRDGCARTSPESARDLVRWAGSKARIRWINTSGPPAPNVCGPFDAHGFYRQDGPAVSAIIGFVRSH